VQVNCLSKLKRCLLGFVSNLVQLWNLKNVPLKRLANSFNTDLSVSNVWKHYDVDRLMVIVLNKIAEISQCFASGCSKEQFLQPLFVFLMDCPRRK